MENDQFKNILVIHFGQLGDVVLALPALRAIRERFSHARIIVMSGKSTAEVIGLMGVADEQIVVDRVDLRDGGTLKSIAKIGSLMHDVRTRRFDLVIDLHSLPETNILSFLSGSPIRLLAKRGNRSIDLLSNYPGSQPEFDRSRHLTDQYLGVLEPLGIATAQRSATIRPNDTDVDFVKESFGDLTGRVALFPGAGHPSRCWPLQNFCELAEELGSPVVFLGPEETHLRAEVEHTFPSTTQIIDGLTLPQFSAALSLVDSFVTNDTGPLHLAVAVGTNVVLLLDERAPHTYLPVSDSLHIISGAKIDEISVEAVAAFLRRFKHPV